MKLGISIKDGKIHMESTLDKLIVAIISTFVFPPLIYFTLLFAEATQPFTLRTAEAILGTILKIAPPLYWAIVMFVFLMIDITRLCILIVREKITDKSDSDSVINQ